MTHPIHPPHPCPPNNPHCGGGTTQPPNPGNQTRPNVGVGMYTTHLFLLGIFVIIMVIKITKHVRV